MALKTTLEQLEEVQNAISLVMGGQSGTWDGKQLTYADLDALQSRETLLMSRYTAENSQKITRNVGRINRG